MTRTSEAEIAELKVKVDHLEASLEKMSIKIDALHETIAQAKGGWRTLMALGGAAAGIGAAAAWMVEHLAWR